MSQSPLPDSNRRPLPYHEGTEGAEDAPSRSKPALSGRAVEGGDLRARGGASTHQVPTEYDGVPGHEKSILTVPWWGTAWCGRHLRGPANTVWSPVAWDEGTYCREVLASDPCAYCGGPVDVIDHIEPRGKGGDNDCTNLIGACWPCNAAKNAKPLLLFMATRSDPALINERRLEVAEGRHRRALMANVIEIGTNAYTAQVKQHARSVESAQKAVDHRRRWLAA